MIIGKPVARWKKNRSPKATSILMKREYEASSERERERERERKISLMIK